MPTSRASRPVRTGRTRAGGSSSALPTDAIELADVLDLAHREGHLGEPTAASGVAHSAVAAWAVPPAKRSGALWIDLGSGGGLPSLPLIVDWPKSSWLLCEQREGRASFLRWATDALGASRRVEVIEGDVGDLEIADDRHRVVTARSFGPPAVVLEIASRLTNARDHLIVSEPPDADRWPLDECGELGFVLERTTSDVNGIWRTLRRNDGIVRARRSTAIRKSPRFGP